MLAAAAVYCGHFRPAAPLSTTRRMFIACPDCARATTGHAAVLPSGLSGKASPELSLWARGPQEGPGTGGKCLKSDVFCLSLWLAPAAIGRLTLDLLLDTPEWSIA